MPCQGRAKDVRDSNYPEGRLPLDIPTKASPNTMGAIVLLLGPNEVKENLQRPFLLIMSCSSLYFVMLWPHADYTLTEQTLKFIDRLIQLSSVCQPRGWKDICMLYLFATDKTSCMKKDSLCRLCGLQPLELKMNIVRG